MTDRRVNRGVTIVRLETKELLKEKATKEVRQWIEEILGIQIKENLENALQDGVILSRVMLKIKPGIMRELQPIISTPYKMLDNAQHFINACLAYGITNTFSPADLVHGKDFTKVLNTILELATLAGKNGFTPKIKSLEPSVKKAVDISDSQNMNAKSVPSDSSITSTDQNRNEQKFSIQSEPANTPKVPPDSKVFFDALENKEHSKLRNLLQEYPEMVDIKYNDNTLLQVACQQNDDEALQLLLDFNANVNVRNGRDSTPLLTASFQGNFNAVKSLINSGANVNDADAGGWTPLAAAVRNQKLELALFLMEKGADTNWRDVSSKQNLLHLSFQSVELTEALLGHGVDPNIRNERERTPIYSAVTYNKADVVRTLIEHGGIVNVQDSGGVTPLHLSNSTVSRVLLELGADVNLRDSSGHTPLHKAILIEDDRIKELSEGDVWIRDNEGRTALRFCFLTQHKTAAKLLFQKYQSSNSSETFEEAKLGILQRMTSHARIDRQGVSPLLSRPEPLMTYVDRFVTKNKESKVPTAVSLAAILGDGDWWAFLKDSYDGKTRQFQMPVKQAEKEVRNAYKNTEEETAPQEEDSSPKDYPKILASYGIELEEKLGSGQFGDVWKGSKNDKPIAVKFLQKATEEALNDVIDELSLLG